MNKNRLILGLMALLLSFSTAFAGDLLDGGPKLQEDAGIHRSVTGTVERIESDMVFLKTEEGTTRNFGVKESQKEGLDGIQKGDKITVELDEGNAIIDIHKEGMVAQGGQEVTGQEDKGGPGNQGHKQIKGTVEIFDHVKRSITLQTDGGKSETFEVKDAAALKLNNVKKGDKVSLELDEQNRVMDAHS